MAVSRCLILFAGALCTLVPLAPIVAQPVVWPEGSDPAWYPDPSSGDLVLLGGDLSDGNYGGGGVRTDGMFQHIAGTHFRAGDGWWLLACRGDGCQLESAELEVIPAPHNTYDGPAVPGQLLALKAHPQAEASLRRSSGNPELRVRERTADDAVILAAFKPTRSLAGLALRRGPLTTWWYSHPRTQGAVLPPFGYALVPASERLLRLPDGKTLRVRQTPAEDADVPSLGIEVAYDGIRQALGLHALHLTDETQPVELGEVLQWVGDLDGDGRPDLLISHGGYFWNVALYLSSLAKPGELVGEAGRFTFAPPDSPGC